MTAPARPPLTDSAWFWALAFSLLALLALVAMSAKYGQRQSTVERKYQAAERTAAGERGVEASSEQTGRRPFSMPGETLIPLWPLAFIMTAIALVSGIMLARTRRVRSPENGGSA